MLLFAAIVIGRCLTTRPKPTAAESQEQETLARVPRSLSSAMWARPEMIS